jgi:predicted permease
VVPRGAPVAVLAYRYWREAFGADDHVVGRALQIGNASYTVIGVAPPGFVGVSAERAPDVFVPITTFAIAAGENKADSYHLQYNWDWTTVVVRRRAGVSEAAATADLTAAFVRSRAAQRAQVPEVTPDEIARPRAIAGAARPAAGPDAGLESRTLLWVSGVALVVLVIACANAANLSLARALRRHRETAMRLALGVSRRRLAAQALVEGAMLALLGGASGVLAAQWGGAALRALVLREQVALGVVADGRTLIAAGALALAAGALTSLAPALLPVRGDLAPTLRAGARADTPRRARARSALLVVQAALSVALLVGAALFVRSLRNVRAMRLGYDPEPVLIVTPNFRGVTMDGAARAAFRRRLLDAARAVPGVVAAARVNSRPFSTNARALFVAGVDSVERLGRFNYQIGSADFFAVMRTRVVRGRAFDARDREGAPPVAVVSESMARALWPGRDPLGMCLHLGRRAAPCVSVVGVSEDAAEQSLTDEQRFVYYLPLEQQDPAGGNRMFVRVAGGDARRHADAVRRALQREMPGQAYVTVQPLEELVEEQRRSWRLGATMFAAFGALAFVVAAVGVYGVIAYDVAQRARELSVRVALGARARDVTRLVVAQGLRLAVVGVASGSVIALLGARQLQPLLFRQSATDPSVYAGVCAALLLAALAACAAPARRAARADPNAALRAE